jgi:hypothetical protein
MMSVQRDRSGTYGSASAPPLTSSPDPGRLREIAAAASIGIDAGSGLASDYLNQFNEVSMILDMAAEDCELLEELEGWSPRGYVEHFENSSFADTPLVLEAWRLSPPETRRRFEEQALRLGDSIREALEQLARESADRALSERSRALAADVRESIDSLSTLIHPGEAPISNADLSTLFAKRQ